MDRELERQLIKKAKENTAAFEELYSHYLPKIYGFLLNRTGQKELAEDLTSEVFAKALANISKFNDRGVPFAAWLFRIARNTLIDYARKKKEILTDTIEAFEPPPENREASATLGLVQDERKEFIRKTMKNLPEKYQTVLSLKFFEELDNDEIADIIGCQKNAVAVRVHRALRLMKKHLVGNPEFLENNF
ncbi:sigma-70 family RNA polymerase sigma factor [Patescibacteria group bacterium]|nr:sigma-70 family RNA polymerase sigma factor [Patescibacteria group bacterium]